MKESPRTVLLVDDEQNILLALKRELHQWAKDRNIEILTALSAKEGLQILSLHAQETILIISDLRMPEMKGSDFLLEVKKKYPHIVSLLLTGYSETEEIIKAVSAGIFSYMLKPWDRQYLIGELDKAYTFLTLRNESALAASRIEEELKWAGEFQRMILRPQLPASDRVEFRVTYKPVPGLFCGGDYYDVIPLGPEKYVLLIGDVAGHGVKAAFVTGILKAVIYPEYFRNLGATPFSPAHFLGWLNSRMTFGFRTTDPILITFFAGLFDMRTMEFTYANAGHTHPCLTRGNLVSVLPVSGSAIGFAQKILYSEQTVALQRGNGIILYTDGLSEVGQGIRVPDVLTEIPSGPDYHARVLSACLEKGGAKAFSDDVTMLTMSVK